MTDAKISALPAMTALAGTELLTGLQTAANANATPAQIKTYTDIGTTTNDNAAAGSIGELLSVNVLAGSAVSLTTNTPANATSLSLTAGDWDVWATIGLVLNAATTLAYCTAWLNSVSATAPSGAGSGAQTSIVAAFTGGNTLIIPVGQRRFSLASTTTIYLGVQAGFAVNTCGGFGYIGARRVR